MILKYFIGILTFQVSRAIAKIATLKAMKDEANTEAFNSLFYKTNDFSMQCEINVWGFFWRFTL